MRPESFDKLCWLVENVVGNKEFKSEAYLDHMLYKDHTTTTTADLLYRNSKGFSGDYVSGEWKLALTLRYLAGATCLDLYLWSNICPNHIRYLVDDVLQFWICHPKVLNIDFYSQVFCDDVRRAHIMKNFGDKSDGILDSCIGALDGWLVKIICPTYKEVDNPGKYFNRKQFYSLNVQVIVDKSKRVLWRCIGELGSSHDSQVFHDSKLGKYMENKRDILNEMGCYIIGDSAYALRSYLLCPYDNAEVDSAEDTFNYFLSSSRIYVECCFGEVDRRWGVLWRPLEGSLEKKKFLVDACLRLHNFILDERDIEDSSENGAEFSEEEEIELLNEASEEFGLRNPGCFNSMNFDGQDPTPHDHQQNGIATEMRNEGKLVRNRLRDELWSKGFRRPSESDKNKNVVRRDKYNRVVDPDRNSPEIS